MRDTDFEALALPGGPYLMHETYFTYDGLRLLFSMRSQTEAAYMLGTCICEDEETETLTYLFAALDAERFSGVTSGAVDLRDAYALSQDSVYSADLTLTDSGVDARITALAPATVPERWLAAPGATLARLRPVGRHLL